MTPLCQEMHQFIKYTLLVVKPVRRGRSFEERGGMGFKQEGAGAWTYTIIRVFGTYEE